MTDQLLASVEHLRIKKDFLLMLNNKAVIKGWGSNISIWYPLIFNQVGACIGYLNPPITSVHTGSIKSPKVFYNKLWDSHPDDPMPMMVALMELC